MDLKKNALSGIKWTTVNKIGMAIFQLLQIAILTRFLPKEAFGLVAIALLVIGFSNIFVDMGLTSAILHKHDATQKEYSSIYWLNLFVSVLLYIFLFILTSIISDFYEQPELLTIIPILAANIIFVAFGRQHRTILLKEFKFKTITIVELCSIFISLIVAVILAINGAGVYSLVYSTLIASILGNFLFLIINFRSNPIKFHFQIKDIKPFIRVGGFQMGSTFLDFISKEADIFIIGKIIGIEALGVYTLSKQLVLKIYGLINPIIVTVLSPLLSAIQSDLSKLKVTFLRVIKYLSYINFPIYLSIIVGSKEILHHLYGNEYTSGSIVLSFLAFYYCIISLSNPVGSLQIATGRTDIGFYWTIIRMIVTPFFIFFGALYGINGVAIAMAILSLILLVPIWYIQLRPMAEISFKEYFKQFGKPLIIFIFLIVSFLVFQGFDNSNIRISILVLKQVLALFSYFLILWLIDNTSLKEFYRYGYTSFRKA